MSVFADILGPEPEWLTCPCGERTARVPCWTCSSAERVRDVERESRDRALATIPQRYAWAALGTPLLAERVRASSDLKSLSERILGAANAILSGPSGAGKTSLGCACLRARPGGEYVSALRLGVARIQSAAGQGEASLVERCMSARLLLIDEVGGEGKTATNAVRDVVFARHDADLPTWITTGFGREQLAEMYGDGFVRRITEGAVVVRLGAR